MCCTFLYNTVGTEVERWQHVLDRSKSFGQEKTGKIPERVKEYNGGKFEQQLVYIVENDVIDIPLQNSQSI